MQPDSLLLIPVLCCREGNKAGELKRLAPSLGRPVLALPWAEQTVLRGSSKVPPTDWAEQWEPGVCAGGKTQAQGHE